MNSKRFIPRAVYLLVILLSVGQAAPLLGQGTRSDYQRLNQQRQTTQNKVFRVNVQPNWIFGEKGLWYRIQQAPSQFEFIVVNVVKGTRDTAFNHVKVAEQLSEVFKERIEPFNLPFQKIMLDSTLENVFFKYKGKVFKVDRKTSSSVFVPEKDIPQQTSSRKKITPSGPSRMDIHVVFNNRRKSPVKLFWIDQEGLPRSYGQVDPGNSSRQHTFAGHVWLVTDSREHPLAVLNASANEQVFVIDENSTAETTFPRRNRPRRATTSFARSTTKSPDGKYRVFVKDHDVFLATVPDGKEFRLSSDGKENDYYTHSIYWSPDSRKVIVIREIPAEKHTVHLLESSPEKQVQPKLHSMNYLKPGDRIRKQRPALFDVETRKQIQLSNKLFSNPWRLRDFRWEKDSSNFYFRYNQRGHQVMRIVGIDMDTGKTRTIIDETSPTFIDYNYKFKVHYLERSDEILWSSERDGWNHLYLYDAKTGELKNQVTKGKWLVRKIDRIDEEKRQVWFQAGGIIPNQDPYYIHFCRVDFDGNNLVVMTRGDGTHSVRYSPGQTYLLDSYSQVDRAPVCELREVATGKLVVKLESGDDTLLQKTGWKRPERFISEGRDGKTPIFGVIYRPSNLDPGKKYPVIEYIYAGPHGSFVPKSYSAYRRTQALAELGFIVVQIDGMGTSNRSKAFHDVCWKNLGDSGFPDRIKWIQAAAQRYPYMDITRVGIFGGSAGGQSSTRALLAHGDFYKVAVSDCGCHDNRMDKIWWNEQWMGWPVGPHYKEQSNVTNAQKLKGKLFLIVGELDRNVDPASTLQVVDALIKANKDFDFLLVPGGGHGIGSRPYGQRRTYDFFVRHLHGVEPRSK